MAPALKLYRALSAAAAPLADWWLGARARRGKEDPTRLGERFGRSEAARPAGQLIWLHGASVGEMGLVLQLRDALAARDASLSFLVTTGTRASAALFQTRAPARTQHQYAPLDAPRSARRFLARWKPDLGVFVESELWPNLILEAHAQGVPLALVNARMSGAAIERWRKLPRSAAQLLGAFALILAADAATAEGLSALAGKRIAAIGNLKLAAAAPPIDARALQALSADIGARPAWLAASTHEGEDEILIAAHARVREVLPDALLILAPRHVERGAAIAALAGAAPRRALGERIGEAAIYVADTMGELGLFYALAPVSFVAGSLMPAYAGHNPVEPAKLESAVIAGPHVSSFAEIYAALRDAGGAQVAADRDSIAAAVLALWADDAQRRAQVAAAARVVAEGGTALENTVAALAARLGDAQTEAPALHASA